MTPAEIIAKVREQEAIRLNPPGDNHMSRGFRVINAGSKMADFAPLLADLCESQQREIERLRELLRDRASYPK